MPATDQFKLITGPRRRTFFGIVHQFLPLASGARGTEDTVTIDGQSDFSVSRFATTAQDNQAKIQLRNGTGLFYNDQPIFISEFGSGQFPLPLTALPLMARTSMRHGFIVPRANTYTAAAWDRQTVPGTNNIRLLSIGAKIFKDPFEPAKAYHKVRSYRYTANFTADDGGGGPIAANAVRDFPVGISGDADFDIYGFSIVADDPNLTLRIQISGRQEEWFNRACHGLLLGATPINAAIPSGGTPFLLPYPYRVPAAGFINCQVADLSGAPNRVQIVFHGLWCEPAYGIPTSVVPAMLDED